MNYEEYLKVWTSGIGSEIDFWNDFISNEGNNYFYGFEKAISPSKNFELEDDIPKDFFGKKYKFIDVGAGPFSRCGRITKIVELEAISVDPLGYIYNELKKEHNIDNGIIIDTGFVELLTEKYDHNSFDMVHMSNSLDHCFSAVDGIYQLLSICKIGGKVILRHAENEAEREKYEGLHQWNLSLHNKENSFVIWRGEQRFDICQIFKEYADFELTADVHEKNGHWIYNKVVMIKKKDIDIPANNYHKILLNVIYNQLLSNCLRESCDNYSARNNTIFAQRMKQIKSIYHNSKEACEVLNRRGISSISIYGMGDIGKNLEYAISKCGIEIKEKIDKRGPDSGCFEAIILEECNSISSDLLVISIDDIKIYETLSMKYDNTKICMIDEFLNIFSGSK